ncbi:glycoside hydrolase family 2 protein [Balneola sp. MJW-20]|uniref:glycoside hydrolase family 2 protein n=1 Tax=Gracilimonas aurantiaca TaxID=3234185 RepID=UPI0034661A65
MVKYVFPFLLLILLITDSFAQDLPVTNVYNRLTHSLNGYWHYIVDPYENGYYNYRYEAFDQMDSPPKSAFFMDARQSSPAELLEYDFAKSDSIRVPGDWNSQKEKLFYYEGTVWYQKRFNDPRSYRGNRLFLYFDAVNYKAEVYLNGTKLGIHEGGFSPFQFEVTDLIKNKQNSLVVKVDNKRVKDGVPTLNTDWWNYGGITRDVKLLETPETYIRNYKIQLDPDNTGHLSGYIQLEGSDHAYKEVRIQVLNSQIDSTIITGSTGRIDFMLPAAGLRLWSPSDPHLYEVQISTMNELIQDNIGFRSIETDGSDILLNGEPVFLKGISIHEENPLEGRRAWSKNDAYMLLSWAKELGCNYVRLAHYPHNEHIVRLADQMGIMVWEEIPVYWTISWDNQQTYINAENQLSELIFRDMNRASVIIWSMANETPEKPERNSFLGRLAEHARTLDPSRLISAALEQENLPGSPDTRTIEDAFSEYVDVLSFNQYIGWYDGTPEKLRRVNWEIKQNKPVIISEFGAGAKFGLRGDPASRWTEDYQAYLYELTLQMLSEIPQLSGISPWILADFRSPRRPLPGIQDGWNRKGLLSDKGEKKRAYYVLQDYYLNGYER